MRVLVVDDDENYIYLVGRILKSMNHEVLSASDGQTAWEIIQAEPVPFVITDWMMPDLDGVDLVRRIRSADFPYYVYLIMLTAKQTKDDVVGGLDAGADDYIIKPFDMNEMRARIAIGERILGLETRLRETMEQLAQQATHDSLTGLYNRRALYDLIDQEMSRSRRDGHYVSLVMMDIDHFKAVNDQFGHLVGDEMLCRVAQTIQECKRHYDQAGRWGGEEFLLVLPGTGLEAACHVAERIRQAIAAIEAGVVDGQKVHLRASFGAASTEHQGDVSFNDLLQQADEALYDAKQSGRNRVCAYKDS